MEPLCLGKPGDPGRRDKDNRLFVEAVLWIAHTGSPWRDLPPSLGHWNSVLGQSRLGQGRSAYKPEGIGLGHHSEISTTI